MDADGVDGPYMWEVDRGAEFFGRTVALKVVTSAHGDLDWCFLYDSSERTVSSLIWSGWAWERVSKVVSQGEY
jgi:hypothetical protein